MPRTTFPVSVIALILVVAHFTTASLSIIIPEHIYENGRGIKYSVEGTQKEKPSSCRMVPSQKTERNNIHPTFVTKHYVFII